MEIDEVFRVIFCKICEMSFGRLEKIENFKDESEFICEECKKQREKNELDRARALGNAVISEQVKEAFKILMGIND